MITKRQFMSLLGPFPKDGPLDIQVLEEVDCSTYKQILVEYNVEQNERIKSYLLVPFTKEKRSPAVLAIHQDGSHRPYEFGKSEPAGIAGDPELAYGKELAERGYTVICPDRFPFESRMLSKSEHAKIFDLFKVIGNSSDIKGVDFTEDLYVGAYSSKLEFEGRTLVGKTLYELKRAVDVLCSLPYVDNKKIGVIGHSAGGFYSALLMYIDKRIKVGCSSCGTFKLEFIYGENNLKPMNGFGGCLIPGLKRHGDVDDLLAQLAPRPFFEASGDAADDSEWFLEIHKKAKSAYEALEMSERYKTIAYDEGHIFRKDMREQSYAWLDRWLV